MQFKPADSVLASAAKGVLAADLSISGTSFTLQAGQGAAFPASDFSVEINGETIDVGTRTNDTFSSLTRANPIPHNGGARGESVYHVTSGAAIADAVAAGPGGSQPDGSLVSKQVLFVETAGAGTYTAEFPVDAGTVVLDVLVALLAVFDADTMAYTVQDGSHFYFNGRTLSVAYDPTGPNALSYASLGSSEGEDYAQAAYNQGAGPGGGGPLTTAGQGVLYPTSDTLTCTVETTGAGGTTGRLFVNVLMLLPIDTAAVVKT